MKKIFKNKIIKFLLKLILSVVFVGLLILKINWAESWQYLQQIKAWQIGIYLVVIFLSLFISTLKWQKLCQHKGLNESFLNFFKLFLTGSFINNFVPSTIGGDIFRAYQIGKAEKKYKEATSTVVMDRFTGLLALMLMSPIFFLLNFTRTAQIELLVWANLIILASLIFLVIFIKVRNTEWIKKGLAYLPSKILEFLRELASFGNERRVFWEALVYAFLFNLIGVGLANLILFWSLGVNINVWDYFSVIFLISIVASIPAGVGLKEWAYIAFFAPLGINLAAVVVVALLNRFLHALVNVVALPIYLKQSKVHKVESL